MKLLKLGGAIIRIGTGLVVMLFALIGLNKYLFGNQERFEKFQQLSSEGVHATAATDGTYKETKFKIKGAEIELYSMEYVFTVNGVEYTGKADIEHPDSVRLEVAIKYLATDPEVNAADVETELEKAREKLNSRAELWLGLGAFLVSILILIFGIRKFRNALKGQ